MVKRSRTRRVADSVWGLLLLVKALLVWALVTLLLVSGVWMSWRTAQHVMLTKGRERGTMTVVSCGDDSCTGPFLPSGLGTPRPHVTITRAVTHRTGERLPVAVEPGTDNVVRTGWAGVLHAWVPLAGALLLAALLLAGGLRMPRTAWAVGAAGAALMGAAFAVL